MTFGTVRLKNVAGVVVSNVDKHSTDGEPAVKLCNYVDVYKNTYIDSNLPFMDSTASEEQVRRYSLRANDVIITKDSETPFDIAVPALVTEDIPGLVCGYHLAVIRANTNALNPRFLLRAFQAKTTASYFATSANGITRYGLTYHSLKNVPLPLPPISEQERIANFLDRETAEADALVVKYERLIELLEEKRVALITQAVTKGLAPNAPLRNSGVEWIGNVPEHWNVTPLSQATSKITNGYVGPTRDILQSDGVRYLQSLHIKNGQIRFDDPYFVSEAWSSQHRKSILRENDLLIVQTGDIGQVAVVPPDFIGCNCHALIIASPREDVVLGKFLSLVLISAYGKAFLQSVQTGALLPHLNCGNVKYFKIPTPPLEEQFAILQSLEVSLERIRTLIRSSEQACKLLGEHRSALITAAVTGQIDVSTYRSKKHPVEVCA